MALYALLWRIYKKHLLDVTFGHHKCRKSRRVVLEDGITSCCLGVRVQFEHYPQVLQRILLQNSSVDLLAGITIKTILNYDLLDNKVCN